MLRLPALRLPEKGAKLRMPSHNISGFFVNYSYHMGDNLRTHVALAQVFYIALVSSFSHATSSAFNSGLNFSSTNAL